MDPFHVIQWMTEALDEIPRRLCRMLRGLGHEPEDLEGARHVVLKNQENLTPEEGSTLDKLRRLNSPLYSAHLLKEQLRLEGDHGDGDTSEVACSGHRIPHSGSQQVATSGRKSVDNIKHVMMTLVTNASTESLNNRIRLITRQAFGFH